MVSEESVDEASEGEEGESYLLKIIFKNMTLKSQIVFWTLVDFNTFC